MDKVFVSFFPLAEVTQEKQILIRAGNIKTTMENLNVLFYTLDFYIVLSLSCALGRSLPRWSGERDQSQVDQPNQYRSTDELTPGVLNALPSLRA